ncbi:MULTISPECIES: glycosyltransferase [unclassified Paludibacterium]|uniref:glycosyltransferase n=1 Tax=unclassified Paludibacterium TaxID=2618429 RepID=UPI001C047E67|nr:glycosyltransferase [Paludibacterium sp. B53371]BEV72201.1 hypothetical protein THUN1379_16830 [Paludibacterium sp. THUN1379]
MTELPIPQEPHHLAQVLALTKFGQQCQQDFEAARREVCQAFGLAGDQTDDPIVYAMLLLNAQRLEEARQLLLEQALATPEKFPSIYALLACVFKYFNAGMTIDQLAGFAIEPMLQLYQANPASPTIQLGLLDMLLYLGLPDECSQVLAQSDAVMFAQEAAELAALRDRIAGQQDRCRLSVVMLTCRRPALLRHTLQILQQALQETDVEIIVGINDDLPETRAVLQQAGIEHTIESPGNIGWELYKQVFAEARGEFIIELDDDIAELPAGFDQQIIACLQQRADLGLVGHWPVGFVDAQDGRAIEPAPSYHVREEVAGLPFGIGPVAGVCAGMRRRDFLAINGFARASLGRMSGEEPQLIRKLALHGKYSGVIFDQGLRVYQDH